MNHFGVLTNRKRAVIALIHSIFFLGIAIHGFSAPKGGILHGGAGGDFGLVIIYLVVSSILAWLVGISRLGIERAYFTLCACSASFGLLRTVFGDSSLPAGAVSASDHAELCDCGGRLDCAEFFSFGRGTSGFRIAHHSQNKEAARD